MRRSLAKKEQWLCGIQTREQRRKAIVDLRGPGRPPRCPGNQLVSVDRSRYKKAARWASPAFAATADHYCDLALGFWRRVGNKSWRNPRFDPASSSCTVRRPHYSARAVRTVGPR